LVQLNKVCATLGLQVLSPDILHLEHGWFAGFLDADGTIGYSLKGPYQIPQLTLSVTNKLYMDVVHFFNLFGGAIYFDISHNGYYKWMIQSEQNILNFSYYTKVCPPQSIKRNRFFLLKEYYRLVNLKAYKAHESTVLHKAWVKFNRKWNRTST
jgi:hypothetical protein